MIVRPLSILACLLTLSPALAQQGPPQGWTWGVGVVVNNEPYADDDTRVLPIPLIGYRSERLTVLGPFVSYAVVKSQNMDVNVRMRPVFNGFEADDDALFEGMADRDFSLAAGVGLTLRQAQWSFELAVDQDLLDKSGGYEVTSTLAHRFRAANLLIEPFIGATLQSDDFVDYYYGVLPGEARVGRPAYRADSATNYQVGINLTWPKQWGGSLRLGLTHQWYDDSIADSPLTDSDTSLNALLAYTRPF
ncbi:MipA/OmpV family protein [Aestuariibacter halophilus]|uniref:MipA/OmpV family protein n=1 Tax=Fluctibacter halophilus TaxID=226011 RepID=A0ABS8G3F4_9ALTE|nr:MipA/OmpV family protein [Aestuariibacter halophilus]MCC2615019.1 MipA/OmpV family protein [Aestuariibacter halophilus]